LLAFLEENYK